MVQKRIQCPGCASHIEVDIQILSHEPSDLLSRHLSDEPPEEVPADIDARLVELRKLERKIKKTEEEMTLREEIAQKYEIELTKREVELLNSRGKSQPTDPGVLEDLEDRKKELAALEQDLKDKEVELLKREENVTRFELELLKRDTRARSTERDPEMEKKRAHLDARMKSLEVKQEELENLQKNFSELSSQLVECTSCHSREKLIYLQYLIENAEALGVVMTAPREIFEQIKNHLDMGDHEAARERINEGIEIAMSLREAEISERAYKKLINFQGEFRQMNETGIDVDYEMALVDNAMAMFNNKEYITCDRLVRLLSRQLAAKRNSAGLSGDDEEETGFERDDQREPVTSSGVKPRIKDGGSRGPQAGEDSVVVPEPEHGHQFPAPDRYGHGLPEPPQVHAMGNIPPHGPSHGPPPANLSGQVSQPTRTTPGLPPVAPDDLGSRMSLAGNLLTEMAGRGMDVSVAAELLKIAAVAHENNNMESTESLLAKIFSMLEEQENEFFRQRASGVISDLNILLKDVGRLIDQESYQAAEGMLKVAKNTFVNKEFKKALKMAMDTKDFIHSARVRAMSSDNPPPPDS